MCPDPTTLSAFFDGETDQAETGRIEAHLAECPACRATLEVFSRRRSALASEVPADIDPGVQMDRFWSYVGQNRIQKVSAPRRLSIPIPLAAAAVLVTALAVAGNFFHLGNRRMPDLVVVEKPVPTPTVVSLTITPGELDQFLTMLEGVGTEPDDGLVVLPAELPVSLFGEPQMVRPASLEGGN